MIYILILVLWVAWRHMIISHIFYVFQEVEPQIVSESCALISRLEANDTVIQEAMAQIKDDKVRETVNSLAPCRLESNFRKVIFKLISLIDGWGMTDSCKIFLR